MFLLMVLLSRSLVVWVWYSESVLWVTRWVCWYWFFVRWVDAIFYMFLVKDWGLLELVLWCRYVLVCWIWFLFGLVLRVSFSVGVRVSVRCWNVCCFVLSTVVLLVSLLVLVSRWNDLIVWWLCLSVLEVCLVSRCNWVV